jgi:hypothetical protein
MALLRSAEISWRSLVRKATVLQNVPSTPIADRGHKGQTEVVERASVQVTFYTRVQEVLGSNIRRDIGYSDSHICGFPQAFKANRPFPFKSFPIHHT